MILDRAVSRIIDAIQEAKNELDFSAQPIIGYTTAAMRMAKNSREVLDMIFNATGIMFQIIDGDKEAALTLHAVRNRLSVLGIEPEPFVLADIGGGSTELIACENSATRSVSLNIGIVTLSESAKDDAELHTRLEDLKKEIQAFAATDKKRTLVLTAGTPTTIAAYLLGMEYASYDPARINGFHLSLEGCYRVYRELLGMDASQRVRYVGVGRENLIIAGILMVTSIYEALGCDEAIVIDDGLREGIALEYFKSS
jgi:exopolyphosphatase/guanosine-5'-triphosphate,3'-diphosphate pyrophosphatase